MGQRQEGRVPTHTAENSPNRQDRRVSPRLGRQATYRQGRQAAGIGTDAGYNSQGHLEAAGKGSGTPRSVQAAPKSQCHSPLGLWQHLEVGTTQRKATWHSLASQPGHTQERPFALLHDEAKHVQCHPQVDHLPNTAAKPPEQTSNTAQKTRQCRVTVFSSHLWYDNQNLLVFHLIPMFFKKYSNVFLRIFHLKKNILKFFKNVFQQILLKVFFKSFGKNSALGPESGSLSCCCNNWLHLCYSFHLTSLYNPRACLQAEIYQIL